MPLSDLTSTQLQKLLRLLQERDSLQAKLAKVNGALAQLDGGQPQPIPLGTRKKIRRTRVTLKNSVLHVLAQAGPDGLNVKEIASRAKAKEGSVSVWIYTTGTKILGFKKIAPGRFTYQKR